MNQQEIMEAMQEKISKLQEQLNEMKQVCSYEVEQQFKHGSMLSSENGRWFIDANMSLTEVDSLTIYPDDPNVFSDEATASGYADAFKVMLELRRCEGAGYYDAGGTGYSLSLSVGDGTYLDYYDISCSEMFAFFPPFPTEEFAEAAMEHVGKERVIAAARFLANYN